MALLLLGGLVLGGTAPAKPRKKGCLGVRAGVVGTKGDDVLRIPARGPAGAVGRGGDDLIIGTARWESICAGAGDDRVIAGPGRDRVFGGIGRDQLDAGPGQDLVVAGNDHDRITGDSGTDRIVAGGGADEVFGELQDDLIFGDTGEDRISGGHGVDTLHGGAGDDLLRGDTNIDYYRGQGGHDTLSFATTTPSGYQGEWYGVSVDLERGYAFSEDGIERVVGVESVIGSPFSDTLRGAGIGSVKGGHGSDHCSGFAVSSCRGLEFRGSIASIETGGGDTGLVVLGLPGGGDDHWQIEPLPTEVRIAAPTRLAAASGCTGTAQEVSCEVPLDSLDYILIWGGGGADEITLAGAAERGSLVRLNGGRGSDRITGSAGFELLESGPDGVDQLSGGGGSDALIARLGPDRLDGGPGNDQFTTTSPCEGHTYIGGEGNADVAGFGLTIRTGVVATLGGQAVARGHGPGCRPTQVGADNEVLEGTYRADVLVGTPGSDPLLIGREGADLIMGLAGNDHLRADAGRDRLYGGRGADLLEAADGDIDEVLDCGAGGRELRADAGDPPGIGCYR